MVHRQASFEYITDVLMRDLVGHDRKPSSFLVYLWLWSHGRRRPNGDVGVSLQTISTSTGLSKSAVQGAAKHLSARGLIGIVHGRRGEPPIYHVHEPWVKDTSDGPSKGRRETGRMDDVTAPQGQTVRDARDL